MKLKIINPAVGISESDIEKWKKYLARYLHSDTVLEFENIPCGFQTLETHTQSIINGAEVLKLVKKTQGQGYQGIFINCFDDPGVVAAREFSDIPVLGPYEPSILFGSMLADRLAIISTDQYGVRGEERKCRDMRTGNRIYKIMDVELTVSELSDDKKLINRLVECCKELEREQVGAAVFGCTGMSHVIDAVQFILMNSKMNIQVVEPLRIGVSTLECMIRMGYKNLIRGTEIGAFTS